TPGAIVEVLNEPPIPTPRADAPGLSRVWREPKERSTYRGSWDNLTQSEKAEFRAKLASLRGPEAEASHRADVLERAQGRVAGTRRQSRDEGRLGRPSDIGLRSFDGAPCAANERAAERRCFRKSRMPAHS